MNYPMVASLLSHSDAVNAAGDICRARNCGLLKLDGSMKSSLSIFNIAKSFPIGLV